MLPPPPISVKYSSKDTTPFPDSLNSTPDLFLLQEMYVCDPNYSLSSFSCDFISRVDVKQEVRVRTYTAVSHATNLSVA